MKDVPLPDGEGGTIVPESRPTPEQLKLANRKYARWGLAATTVTLAEIYGLSRQDMIKILAQELEGWTQWDG